MGNLKYSDRAVRMRMICAFFAVCLVVLAVAGFFLWLKKNQEKRELASNPASQEEMTEEMYGEADTAEGSGEIHLIKGKETGSNRYERVDRLPYTDSVRYTDEEVSCLDSYGLCITRNEIYAHHGRMFNDQEIQDFFNRQAWYVARYSSADFNEDLLNEVEKDNIKLIRSYELKKGK